MEDTPEDLPKPPRRSAARPFFSPRPNSGEGVTGPLELSRRRAAQLFTPPGSSPASPLVDKAEAPTARADASSDIEFEGDWTAPPLIAPERTLDAESLLAANDAADDDRLVVEQFEHEEIELTASASNVPDEHSIEVIAYDDANSLLQATASEGENPAVDGLQLESTEFSFGQAAPPPRMNVDSFWGSAPFARVEDAEPATSAASLADVTEARIDAETAGEPLPAAERPTAELAIENEPLERTDDPSTTISHAQAALEPEPEHDPAPGRDRAKGLADISPPWMNRLTPASSQSLEQLKESEPWDLTPSQGLELIPEERQLSEPNRESAAHVSAVAGQPAVNASAAGEGGAAGEVADALVRIAARVRDGELAVPVDGELSDEAALSAVLTALLRLRR